MAKLSAKERKEHEAFAAIPFRAMKIDLQKGMTNEDLGTWMLPVRMAACLLKLSKRKLTATVAADFKEDKEEDAYFAFDMIARLTEAEEKFPGLAKICEQARLRVMVAAHAASR